VTALVIDILSAILIAIGSFFIVTGAIALLRFPDVYSRIHGASVIDTAGAGFLILGLILQAGFTLVTFKLLFILAIFFFTLPVAGHALGQVALHEKIKPILTEDRRDKSGGSKGQGSTPSGGRES
jgi:multicomponent Na+:H+ antiporter subunit G